MARKKENNFVFKEDGVYLELRRVNKESLWTIIDYDDYERVKNFEYSWHSFYNVKTRTHYAMSCVYDNEKLGYKSKSLYMQYFLLNPEKEDGIDIDHINHDTLDNRKSNLRKITRLQNSKHKSGKNINNKSGYRNVSWLKSYNAWCVQLQIEGKNTLLGKFDNVHEAGAFAKEMREKYYGEFAGKG